jgi:hypothetical protein
MSHLGSTRTQGKNSELNEEADVEPNQNTENEQHASDAEFLMDLFDEGLVPANVSHDGAVPDYYLEDETVYETTVK